MDKFYFLYLTSKIVPPAVIFHYFKGYLKHRRYDTIMLEKFLFITLGCVIVKIMVGIKDMVQFYNHEKRFIYQFLKVFLCFYSFPSYNLVILFSFFHLTRTILSLLVLLFGVTLIYMQNNSALNVFLAILVTLLFDVIGNRIIYKNVSDWYDFKCLYTDFNAIGRLLNKKKEIEEKNNEKKRSKKKKLYRKKSFKC